MARTKIITDNDGVNIDSEDVAMRIMDDAGVALVRRYKLDANLPKDYIYTTYPGTSTNKIVEALIAKFDLPVAQIAKDNQLPQGSSAVTVSEAIAAQITKATNDHFKAELKSIPGTTQAWKQINDMFGSQNVALATTSPKDRMDVSLSHAADPVTGKNAELDALFPKGAQRRSGYGHDNKYDEAFAALGWKPSETIIVEDSLSGVTKAKAGRPEVAVIGTVAAKFYEDKPAQAKALIDKGANIVISDMRDLPRAAAWLKAGAEVTALPTFKSPVFLPEAAERPATKAVVASNPTPGLGGGAA